MSAVRNYAIVTSAYFLFTITDGAIRMLVLLHFYSLGYTPFILAFLFLLYETAGIFANLGGGWLALRFGIPRMLAAGLILQIVGLLMLSGAEPGLERGCLGRLGGAGAGHRRRRQGPDQDRVEVRDQGHVAARCGAIVPLGGLVHRLEERDQGRRLLHRRPLAAVRRLPPGVVADGGDAGALCWPASCCRCRARWARRSRRRASGNCSPRPAPINLIAAARIFMFGSRDVWFVVGLPVFLYGFGWQYMQVAGFVAAWTIGYGGVQASGARGGHAAAATAESARCQQRGCGARS